MKIDSSAKSLGNLQKSVASRSSSGAARAAQPQSGQQGGESSTVVAASIHQAAETGASFNAEKVAELRQAIADGRFQVNTERIADGLIASVRDMLSKDRHAASS